MFQSVKKCLILFVLCFIPNLASANSHDVFGLWQSEAQDGHIRVVDCGDGTPCGTLIWTDPVKTVSDYDVRNKNEQLRGRTLIGVPIIWSFKRNETGWTGGKIYNPEDGKIFRASVKRQSADTLKVKGCLGPFCITNRWTRISSGTEKATS